MHAAGRADRTVLSTRGVPHALLRVALPKALAGALLVAVNVAVARALGPASYGAFALAFTCVLLLDAIAGPSIDLIALRGAADDPIATVTATERALLRVKLLVAGAGVLAALVLGPVAGPWFGVAASESLTLSLAVACSGLALLLLRSAQVRLQLDQRLERYGVSELMQAGGRALLVALAIAAGVSSPAALIALGGAAAALAATLAWPSLWRTAAQPARLERALAGTAALTALTCAVGAIGARLDPFVLGAVAPARDVGLYSAALVTATVAELAGAYAAPALAPRLMPLWQRGELRSFVARVQTAAWGLALLVFACALWIVPALYDAVLPAEYAGSGQLALVLLPAGLSGLIIFPVALNVILMRAPHVFLWIDTVSLAALLPIWAWAGREHGAFGVAAVTAAWRIVKAILVSVMAIRLASQSPAPALSPALAAMPAVSGAAPSLTVQR
jgi:O-antigen/teichoic acid export membrane protein